ncbi:MAG: hypothetical protein WCJ01_05735 [Ignavibacteria bacterium]
MDKNSVSYKFARIISTTFVPPSFTILLLPFFAFVFESTLRNQMTIILVALTFGFSFQIIMVMYLIRKGKVVDIDATLKEERSLPFSIAIILYTPGLFILLYFNINIITVSFWFCYISDTLILILINRYWKISAHAIGASGPVAALTLVSPKTGFFFFLLLIIICWSRIKLKKHTLLQVIAGSLFGFVMTLVQMKLFLKYFH